MSLLLVGLGIEDLFLSDKNREMVSVELSNIGFNNFFGLVLGQVLQEGLILLVVLVRNKINKIKTNFSAFVFFLTIYTNFDPNSFEVFRQNGKFLLT